MVSVFPVTEKRAEPEVGKHAQNVKDTPTHGPNDFFFSILIMIL